MAKEKEEDPYGGSTDEESDMETDIGECVCVCVCVGWGGGGMVVLCIVVAAVLVINYPSNALPPHLVSHDRKLPVMCRYYIPFMAAMANMSPTS